MKSDKLELKQGDAKDIALDVDMLKINAMSIEAKMIADNIEITDDDEAVMATDSLSKIKKFQKSIETERKQAVQPFNELVKRVNTMFKPISDSLDDAERIIKEKIGNYAQEKEKRRQKEEQKRLEEFAKKIAEEQAKARAEKRDANIVAPPVTLLQETQIRGTSGITSTSKFWNYEVENIQALFVARPDLVKIEPKHREILDAIKSNQAIAGLRIYEDIKVVAR